MSEETRGAYRPQVGDTVRHQSWTGTAVEVLAVGKHKFFAVESDGHETTFNIDGRWVKVEPTPADRWMLIRADGSQVPSCSESAHLGLFRAGNLDHCFPDQAPHRVARFSFAGWEG